MFPPRIGVRGPRGPHCHRRDRAPRSSSVHWSCSQETRAAETQSQAQGISAPLNPFHPHKPTRSFLPLISREPTWAEARKRWHWLWSGVIFFSDWAAISILWKERKKDFATHSVLTQTAGPASEHMMLGKLSSKALLDIILRYVARRRNYTAGSSSLCWNEFKCVMNCCDPFHKRGPLSYWTYFLCFIAVFLVSKLNWGRLFQPVIRLPHTAVLPQKQNNCTVSYQRK